MSERLNELTRWRWRSILSDLGIDLKYLSNKHTSCPICGGKDRFRFDDKNGMGTFYCNTHGPGNGFILAMQWLGCDAKTTSKKIMSIVQGGVMTEKTNNCTNDVEKNTARIKKIHRGLCRITIDNAAGKYLSHRGIKNMPNKDCYFHPAIAYYDGIEKQGDYPAMVSVFRTSENEVATYHITYLTNDGMKAPVPSVKKIMPVIHPISGSAIKLFRPNVILGISEGIETALSVEQNEGVTCWAAGSANGMINVAIPDEIKCVIIYSDNDYTGKSAAYQLATRLLQREKKEVSVVVFNDRQPIVDAGEKYDFNDYIKCLQYI